MVKRRRLGDLYVTGEKVIINDDSGLEAIEVWIQKLNPMEQENALRRGSAERAKYLAMGKDHESDLWHANWSDIQEFTTERPDLLELALRDELNKIRTRIEAEISGDEYWAEEGHLQEIFDAWNGTSHTIIDAPPADADADEEPSERDLDGEMEPARISYLRGEEDHRYAAAAAIYEEIKKWGEQVDTAYAAEKARLFADYEAATTDELLDMATERMIEQKATSMMLEEFQIQELFYSVRQEDDHSKKYFGTRDEVKSVQPEVRDALINVYRNLYVDPAEGKDLPGTPGSSAQSDSSDPEATPTSSGPEA